MRTTLFVAFSAFALASSAAWAKEPTLASDDARYLTGNTLYVDGGGHINGINWASLFD